MVSKKDIEKCIKLLHNDYQKMGTEIFIYNSRLKFILYYYFNPKGSFYLIKNLNLVLNRNFVEFIIIIK